MSRKILKRAAGSVILIPAAFWFLRVLLRVPERKRKPRDRYNHREFRWWSWGELNPRNGKLYGLLGIKTSIFSTHIKL